MAIDHALVADHYGAIRAAAQRAQARLASEIADGRTDSLEHARGQSLAISCIVAYAAAITTDSDEMPDISNPYLPIASDMIRAQIGTDDSAALEQVLYDFAPIMGEKPETPDEAI